MPVALPTSSPINVRRFTLANLSANIGLILTGGLVRLTGSGLGCAEWPTCNDGNVIPHGEAPIHTYIEFINRLLTFVLVAIALLTWLILRRMDPPRPDMVRLAFWVGLGIPAQGVLGGITVLTGLNPYSVMAHMMLTMVLIYWAAVCYYRARHLNDAVEPYASTTVHWLARAIIAATYLTLALGTFVTGAGPHSGDPEAGRTGFDPALVSQLHADAVFLLVGLSIGLAIFARVIHHPGLTKATMALLGLEVLQGIVGYVQYFTNLPIVLVAIHMVLAGVLVVLTTNVAEELRTARFAPRAN